LNNGSTVPPIAIDLYVYNQNVVIRMVRVSGTTAMSANIKVELLTTNNSTTNLTLVAGLLSTDTAVPPAYWDGFCGEQLVTGNFVATSGGNTTTGSSVTLRFRRVDKTVTCYIPTWSATLNGAQSEFRFNTALPVWAAQGLASSGLSTGIYNNNVSALNISTVSSNIAVSLFNNSFTNGTNFSPNPTTITYLMP
jgi:hypothetical protein